MVRSRKAESSWNGISRGLKKGHVVTATKEKKAPASRRHSKRNLVVKELVREVAGFAPYERRMMEIIKIGGKDKRALRFAKKRLGTMARARAKKAEMEEVVRRMRKN